MSYSLPYLAIEPTDDEIWEEANRIFEEKYDRYDDPELAEMNNRCQGQYKGMAKRNLAYNK